MYKVSEDFGLASLANSYSYKFNRRKTEKQKGRKLLHTCILIHMSMKKAEVTAMDTQLRESLDDL